MRGAGLQCCSLVSASLLIHALRDRLCKAPSGLGQRSRASSDSCLRSSHAGTADLSSFNLAVSDRCVAGTTT